MDNHSIFISYRIDDTLTQAGRLHQSLEAHFGAGTVFYDKDSLAPGMKWDEVLEAKVGAAQIVLVLYKEGKKWLGVDDFGQRRIDKPDDWVRREVETGLTQGKIVIPVLINDAKLPPEAALPVSLQPLLKCQGWPIREAFWDNDLRTLTDRIEAVLGTTNKAQTDGDRSNSGKKATFQAFTCDRIEQTDAFAKARPTPGVRQPRFFYLYGHEYQAHKSFFARLAFEFEEAAVEQERRRKAIQINLSIKESRDPQVYREKIICDLFVAFGLNPDEHHPLLAKNLPYLLEKSPKVKELKPGDAVFLLAHVSHWTWDKNLTPAAARWFITEFCQCDLSADLPTFLLFFSFDYDEEYDPAVKNEILAAVADSTHVQALPELGMVQKRDIGAWLSVNQALVPSTQDRNDILKKQFDGAEFFMENVETILTNIIDKYKNQQIR